MDVKELEGNWPPAQKESPQPKYKTLSFHGWLEDSNEDWYEYNFSGNYYEFEGCLRFVECALTSVEAQPDFVDYPVIDDEGLQNILRIDIREELNTDYTIIFETQIELK